MVSNNEIHYNLYKLFLTEKKVVLQIVFHINTLPMAESAEKQKEYIALEQFLNPQFTEYHKYNTNTL